MRHSKKQKLLSIFLVLMLAVALIPMSAFAVSVSDFTDIGSSHWAYKYVQTVVAEGLFEGTSSTKFEPEASMTRAMFVTVLARLEGVELDNEADTGFGDVPSGQWYTGAVAWAVEEGIVNGTSETTFDPNALITREQMAALIVRYTAYAGIELAETVNAVAFTDASSISSYAKDAVETCQKAGLINGLGDGTFAPQAGATRAQVAAILHRLMVVMGIVEDDATYYTVTFNSNGGSSVSSQSVLEGSKATKPTDPTRSGYTFGGWFSDEELTNGYDFSAAVTASFTLYAKWTQNTGGGGGTGGGTLSVSDAKAKVQYDLSDTILVFGNYKNTVTITATARYYGSNNADIEIEDSSDQVVQSATDIAIGSGGAISCDFSDFDEGTYTATITVGSKSASVEFEISDGDAEDLMVAALEAVIAYGDVDGANADADEYLALLKDVQKLYSTLVVVEAHKAAYLEAREDIAEAMADACNDYDTNGLLAIDIVDVVDVLGDELYAIDIAEYSSDLDDLLAVTAIGDDPGETAAADYIALLVALGADDAVLASAEDYFDAIQAAAADSVTPSALYTYSQDLPSDLEVEAAVAEVQNIVKLINAEKAANAAIAALSSYTTAGSVTSVNRSAVQALVDAAEAAVEAYVDLGGTATDLTGYASIAAVKALIKDVVKAEAIAAIAALSSYTTAGSVTSVNRSDVQDLVDAAVDLVDEYLDLGGLTSDLTNYAYIATVQDLIDEVLEEEAIAEILDEDAIAVGFSEGYTPMVVLYNNAAAGADTGKETGLYYVASLLIDGGTDADYFYLTVPAGWEVEVESSDDAIAIETAIDNEDGTWTYKITPSSTYGTNEKLLLTHMETGMTHIMHLLQVADVTVIVEGAQAGDKVELISRQSAPGVNGQNNPLGSNIDVTTGARYVYDVDDYLLVDITLGDSSGVAVELSVDGDTGFNLGQDQITNYYYVQLDESASYVLTVTFS